MSETSSQKNDEKVASTFTIDNFSSTTQLANNEVKLSVGSSTDTINEKVYEPFNNRPTEHTNSSAGSLVHLVKSSLGTGILAMPNAFKNGGLIFGFVGTLVVGFLCTHCVHILVKASHEMCREMKKPLMGFAETAGAVFENGPAKVRKYSKTARYAVDVALVVTYFTGGSVYIVFISESLEEVLSHHYDLDWDRRIYMAMIILPIILTCQFRQLKYLVPFSLIANIFMFTSFGITLYYLFTDDPVDRDELEMIGGIKDIPLFLTTVIFAMEGIGVVMPVENTMKKPQQFLGCPGVLNIAMSIVVILYTALGFFGYMTYGDSTKANITLNLPADEALAEVAQIFIALAVFFTYSLQFHVPMEILWNQICVDRIPKKHHNISQIVIRTAIVLGSLAIAMLVPDLEPIMSLVGAICLSTLGILIPSIVETILCWETRLGVLKWRLIKNTLLGLFSLFALVSGSYFAVLDIIG